MNSKAVWLLSLALLVLSAALPLLNIPLPFGNPNFGSAPATLAALFLPWPVGVVCGLVKGIAAALATGRWLIELPAGLGDALMALFTYWLVRYVRWKALAAVIGQLSRYLLTSGVVALSISLLVAAGMVPVQGAPLPGLTASFALDLVVVWRTISYPSMTLSITFNSVALLIVVLVFGGRIAGCVGRSGPGGEVAP